MKVIELKYTQYITHVTQSAIHTPAVLSSQGRQKARSVWNRAAEAEREGEGEGWLAACEAASRQSSDGRLSSESVVRGTLQSLLGPSGS